MEMPAGIVDAVVVVTLAAVTGLVRWVWSIQAKTTGDAESTLQEIAKIREESYRHRLEVAEKYASKEMMREVEDRLVASLENLRLAIEALTTAFNEHRVAVATSRDRREEGV